MDRTKAIELLGDISRVVTQLWYREGAIDSPIIHFMGKSGEVVTSLPPLDKNVANQAVRYILAEEEAQWVIMISEAWVLEGKGTMEEVEAYVAEHGSIENHPDRTEIISYMFEDEDLGTIMAEQQIIEVEGKRILRVLEIKKEQGEVEGRFVGMLPRKGSMH